MMPKFYGGGRRYCFARPSRRHGYAAKRLLGNGKSASSKRRDAAETNGADALEPFEQDQSERFGQALAGHVLSPNLERPAAAVRTIASDGEHSCDLAWSA